MSRGSNLHRTEEGRKKLNFTKKLKKEQDKKKYQQVQNKQRNVLVRSENSRGKIITTVLGVSKFSEGMGLNGAFMY